MPDPYEKLNVWRLADDLVLKIYQVTATFPPSEKYALALQLRRAAVSIPTNIVEGNARNHRREYIHFCYIARGSIAEVKYLMHVSMRLKFLAVADYEDLYNLYDQLGRLLQAMINRLQRERDGLASLSVPSP